MFNEHLYVLSKDYGTSTRSPTISPISSIKSARLPLNVVKVESVEDTDMEGLELSVGQHQLFFDIAGVLS